MSKVLMGEQLCGPQHEAKLAASLEVLPVRVGAEGAEPLLARRRPMDAVKNLKSQPPRTLRRKGCGTNRVVTAGTGEALPGPMTCDVVTGETCPITGLRREVGVVSGGRRRRPQYLA